MNVKRALILSAGFGTRMGEIGKVLPKIIWPVFSKSLLELQVLYLKEMGIEEIFINLHHQKDVILDYCSNIEAFRDINFLIEDQILGVGGAIHNLASKVDYKDDLLIVNADQFCFFDDQYWEKASSMIHNHSCSLFANQVHKKHKYNETVLNDNGYLESILPIGNQTGETHLTYGGFGYINLEKLKRSTGRCDFFTHVADYKSDKIPMTVLPKGFEYWDFGTKERYYYQMQKLQSSQGAVGFTKFLDRCGVSMDEKFYYEAQGISGLILGEANLDSIPSYNFIAYKNIIEKINIDESLL